MVITLPAVVIFGAATLLLTRSRMVRMLDVMIIGLFGFFLASTGLGAALSQTLASIFHLHH